MIRKLLLLVTTAVAALAFTAASSSAQVVVENPGMHEIGGENTLAVVLDYPEPEPDGTKIPLVQCANDWEANIDASGHVNIHRIDFAQHAGSTANCDTANDCDDAGWEGQIVENLQTGHEFSINVTFCLEGTNTFLDGVSVPVACEVDNSEAHCNATLTAIPFMGHLTPVEVEGEVPITGPLGLMH